MKQRQQSSTSYPITFLMVSSTDHVTAVTGLTPTVTISKNGGAFGSPSGAVSEIGSGWYALAGNATDRETLGELLVHATGTGADPVDDRYTIVPWNPFDAVRMGLAALPNAAAEAAGGLYTRGTGAGQINQAANGQIDANAVAISGDSTAADNLEAACDGTGYNVGGATANNAAADALLNRNVSGGSSTGRLVKQALHFIRNKWAVSGGTLTVYETDDSTPSWTSTVTTDSGAEPIVTNDPS